MRHKRKRGLGYDWPALHWKFVRIMKSAGYSASAIAFGLNKSLGTDYTKNAILGKIHRMKNAEKTKNETPPTRLDKPMGKAPTHRRGARANPTETHTER